MREPAQQQAASIRATAKAFGLPARLLYSAVKEAELSLYRTTGRRGVLLFDDVREFLRKRPAPTRTRTPKHKAGTIMPSPDHMAGINALPRWDPSNPTTYSYDPKNYNPQDYAKFKQARQQRDQQRNAKDLKDFQAAMKSAATAVRNKVTELQHPNRTRSLEWNGDSTCFSDLYFSAAEGGVWASFARDGSEYFYPMSKAEAQDWFDDPSAGGYFNAEIR